MSGRFEKFKKKFLNFGLGKERDFFVENFSMLTAGGMSVLHSLDAIRQELSSKRMKQLVQEIIVNIEAGGSLWKSFENSELFPDHVIFLIRTGEESGNLAENLEVAAIEQEKSRAFRSKMRSAMMYPAFVLVLTVFIGIGISWFILPRLATVFDDLQMELPIVTKVLIDFGNFLGAYGHIFVPLFSGAIILIFYFVFIFARTKFIGEFILLHLPGIKKIIKEVELARFGYLLGTLLDSGLSITKSLYSLSTATDLLSYRNFYSYLCSQIEDGNSLRKSFEQYKGSKKLIPVPIQQLIISGEESGTLSESLKKIGANFEAKADITAKNLSVILEPVLLVIVWLGVVAVALAVILPIYNLIGGFNA